MTNWKGDGEFEEGGTPPGTRAANTSSSGLVLTASGLLANWAGDGNSRRHELAITYEEQHFLTIRFFRSDWELEC